MKDGTPSGIMMQRRWLIVIAILVLPLSYAQAEAPRVIHLDRQKNEKRFIPLENARAEQEQQGGITITRQKKSFPLNSERSDAKAIKNGGMRIDRAKAVPIPPQHALPPKSATAIASPMTPSSMMPPKPADATAEVIAKSESPVTKASEVTAGLEQESDGIEGDTEIINPVLALYGGSEGIVSGSFRDVLSGRPGAGLLRHLIWPIPLDSRQYVSSGYGIRNDPFHGRPTFHGGIDIAADVGTPVLATADGVVTEVKNDAGYGKYVTLQHSDGTLTRYGHLSAQAVSVGQKVKGGQVIAAVGSTGRSTGAHLDYRVSKNNVKYDPLSIITIPESVSVRAASPTATAARARAPAVDVTRGGMASNPTPRRPMVIQVQ